MVDAPYTRGRRCVPVGPCGGRSVRGRMIVEGGKETTTGGQDLEYDGKSNHRSERKQVLDRRARIRREQWITNLNPPNLQTHNLEGEGKQDLKKWKVHVLGDVERRKTIE